MRQTYTESINGSNGAESAQAKISVRWLNARLVPWLVGPSASAGRGGRSRERGGAARNEFGVSARGAGADTTFSSIISWAYGVCPPPPERSYTCPTEWG
ncbi:hypothetical protein EVAR_49102_1 [Eumeta japonica]|uniref:Uncharacterized protein n=1 Tax=Eumeta variegata TaxID=151549 RepID=A0A4C1ZUC9_EUMVA|nr:hypothetical protein EVAR_49102_1 [Eumeta japonica]